MKKRFRLPGDELESAVLAALWDVGIASVRKLHERVGVPKQLVYTTTAKVVDRLRAKGLILRLRRGTAFLYRARVLREEIEHARAHWAVTALLESVPHGAVAALVEAVESISPNLLDELERAVADKRRKKDGT